jgi:hypothetical protein
MLHEIHGIPALDQPRPAAPVETTRLGLEDRVTRNDAVVYRAVGSEILLVHRLLKQYHVLNSVAGRIWTLADGEHSLDQIADVVAEEYQADIERVRHDVVETVEGLAALQLVVTSSTR